MTNRISLSPDCAPYKGAVMYKIVELIIGENLSMPFNIIGDVIDDVFIVIIVSDSDYEYICRVFDDEGLLEPIGGPSGLFANLPSALLGSSHLDIPNEGDTFTYSSSFHGADIYVSISRVKDMKAFEYINPITLN